VAAPAPAMGQQPFRPAALLTPTSGSWLGAYVKDGTPQNNVDRERMITDLESSIGRKLGIDHHFFGFKDQIASGLVQWDVKNGRVPLISWQATDSLEVTSGRDDGWITSQAKAIKRLKEPMFIRYGWEPDLAQNADWVHSADDYIAAWRHLHDLFGEAGATNVAWVWCPTSFSFTSGKAFPYYPGDAYVDWDCADGYNWSPGRPGNPW